MTREIAHYSWPRLSQAPLISVIIPVYNTKNYLDKCFSSLQIQTLENIEVIVIDDGSTDGSGEICDKYAADDTRFRVIHREHGGPSLARNDGIDLAQADYIMFVDSDDWVDPDYCKIPYLIAKENEVDIVAFLFFRYDKKTISKQRLFPREGIATKDEVLTCYLPFTSVAVWNKLYRKELFQDMRFPVGHLCEDWAITPRIIHKAKSIFLLNKYLYHYLDYRPGSTTNSPHEKYTSDAIYYGFKMIDDLKSWGYECTTEEQRIAFRWRIRIGGHSDLTARCDSILKNVKHVPYDNPSWKQKAMFRIYKGSPMLFDAITLLTRRRIKE